MSLKTILAILVFMCFLLNFNACSTVIYEFEFNGEPAGDVRRFNETGNMTIVEEYPEIDLKRFETKNGTGDNLTFTLGTKGKKIRDNDDTKYVFRIFTSSDNKTGYNITYRNGTITIVEFVNGVEQSEEDITHLGGIEKIRNEEFLVVEISKGKYIPEQDLIYFGVDAYSWMETSNYTYIDYIHNVPGNPGVIAEDIIDDPSLTEDDTKGSEDDSDDKSGSGALLIIPLIIIILFIVVLLIVLKKRKQNK
ncbi:MAG: hypothetical protein JSV49_10915 [Thermoplasmata archaeon]|nr:MAG: hypothetical protein JSV49_10915 [Thermoplasmata archaeon]